jgi:hypothetical protein
MRQVTAWYGMGARRAIAASNSFNRCSSAETLRNEQRAGIQNRNDKLECVCIRQIFETGSGIHQAAADDG